MPLVSARNLRKSGRAAMAWSDSCQLPAAADGGAQHHPCPRSTRKYSPWSGEQVWETGEASPAARAALNRLIDGHFIDEPSVLAWPEADYFRMEILGSDDHLPAPNSLTAWPVVGLTTLKLAVSG